MSADALDPESLRAYVRRDWGFLRAVERAERATQSLERSSHLVVALYEAARATLPGWPTDADRMEDLEHHIHVRSILRRAAFVGAR